MITVTDSTPEEAIERWMAAWFDLLGAGQLARACEQLDLPAGDGEPWTPARLMAALEDHFGPGTVFRRAYPEAPRFTPASNAAGRAHSNVTALLDGSGFIADCAIPLNGEFSDLSGIFEFLWSGQALLVALYDLHVL